MKAVILLSDKSSGSSAIQRELARAGAQTLKYTPHMEGETLYWMKAAALLEMEQPTMRYSSVIPYSKSDARAELIQLISQNAPDFTPPFADDALVFDGWTALCRAHVPALFEKSPHHLHSLSALSLLLQASAHLPEVTFRFIGLVRNPVDTLYSMWSRWQYLPEVREREWVRAYTNLLWFKERVNDAVRVVRYEDVVSGSSVLEDLVAFSGFPRREESRSELHARSVQKWREDPRFGYQPSEAVLLLGERLGYDRSTMLNPPRVGWSAYSRVRRALRASRQTVARLQGRVS